ncbi:MAG: HAD-IC family P-type ATPase, partial [Deltaproteobacteria bacterium]|nr:HAD-IC family P-type ATPase [Deltaproteobacteria bacterium]
MASKPVFSPSSQGKPAGRDDWHSLTADQTLAALPSSPDGLSDQQALERQRIFGPNELAQRDRSPVWRLLLAQFKNVMLLTLMAALVLSVAMGKTGEAVAIGVIVLFAAGLSFAQEFKAEKAIASLRAMTAPLATVIRGGKWLRLPARELVPGDLLVLAAGDRIPADARVLEAANLRVDESALTGESVPVEKQVNPVDAVAPLAERSNMVHAATTAVFGRGQAVVTSIGTATQVGKIAGMIAQVREPATPLQRDLDRVGKQLLRGSLAVVAVVVLLGLQRGQALADMVIFGIALAVAVVPEALPAVVTVSLALGVQRLARRNAVLRRLAAAETLGSTTVICTDKTGTLTRNEMTVRGLWLAGQDWQVCGAGYSTQGGFAMQNLELPPSALVRELATAAVLASDAHFEAGQPASASTLRGDPTEGALVVLAHKAEIDVAALRSAAPRLREQPFTSESKRMACVHQTSDGLKTFVKGAPEVLLSQCRQWATDDGRAEPFGTAERELALAAAKRMADGALRVMAIARADG